MKKMILFITMIAICYGFGSWMGQMGAKYCWEPWQMVVVVGVVCSIFSQWFIKRFIK
jgi:hypothetical protein